MIYNYSIEHFDSAGTLTGNVCNCRYFGQCQVHACPPCANTERVFANVSQASPSSEIIHTRTFAVVVSKMGSFQVGFSS